MLDLPALRQPEDERRSRVLNAALRNVNLHGLDASITDDGARVHLEGGSVSLDIGLSATILEYIRTG